MRSKISLSPWSLLAVVWLAASGPSHAALTTVPNAYASTPGTGSFLGPLSNSPRTYQLLINESQLTEHLGLDLNAISFRLLASAAANWPAVETVYGNYDIRLSGSVNPSARSLTFANNVVGAQTLVRSGALIISPGSFSSGSSPNAFGLSIGFDSAYAYTGGNLLVEIRHTGSSSASTSVEAMLTTGSAAQGYGTLFSAAWNNSYTGLSGSQGNFAVLQVSSVPEPATTLLLAAGILGLVLAAKRQRASDSQ